MQSRQPRPARGDAAPDGRHLLEREEELARIGTALDQARTGREGSLLLVEGPPGIGKSALLAAAARTAAETMTVLSARATELDREFAFGVLRQLLEPPLRTMPAHRRREALAGAAAPAAAALGLARTEPRGPESGFATLNGLYWLVSALGEQRPLLLLLDDIHWADRDTLRFLAFLAPRLGDLPVSVLSAARPGESRFEALFAATASDPACRPLAPKALSQAATTAVVESSFDIPVDPAFARACHQATGGNPFYLRAMLDELRSDAVTPSSAAADRVLGLGPRSVAQTILVRLARLTLAAPGMARALAVLGDEADPARASRLAAVDPAEARAATEAMIEAAVLVRSERPAFAHPIIRNAVYNDIGHTERAGLHRRAIDLLRTEGVAPERLVAHLLAVEPRSDPEAVAMLASAATEALRRGAVDTAVACLRRALEEPPSRTERADVLLRLGRAEMLVDGPAAIAHLSEALEVVGGPEDRADAAADLARALIFAGRGTEAVAVAERAAADIGDRDGARRRTLTATILSAARTEPELIGLRDDLTARLRAGGDLEADDAAAKALAVGLAYVDAHACVPAAEVMPRIERALAGRRLLHHDNGGTDFIAAVIVCAMADSELASATLTEGLEAARERGDGFAWAANKIFSCLAHLVRGELTAAVAAGQEGLAAADAYDIAIGRPWGSGYLATAQLAMGEHAAAARTLSQVSAPPRIPFSGVWAPYVDARARMRLERGEVRAALEDSLWCAKLLDAIGVTNPALLPWRSRAALCLARLGEDPGRAVGLADEEVAFAGRWGAPRALGAALRCRGMVEPGGPGLEHLRRAVGVLEGSPARLERARALLDLGAALRRDGRRSECRDPLGEAMALARSIGAVPLAERAYQELRAGGARVRKLVYSGIHALTPSQHRVARLAAEGRANREIAQELFVSVKTVEWHLGQIYRKLDITSRRQLAGALGEESGPDRSA
ncbi:helix-turn-helix transcriptional regulator [Glycomyces xiaoerkulensis]|uniref:helix-turn-helix transcriptional regulator n=1 Tax=Glycomyces xiaoerkulensis TaxID=2038139 RepID=UPI0018E4AE0C|nr:LuxR family transcriptional regulator [Glycomyces xiaoerkulensis]